MRILFTKLRHIGDNLLITPTLVATKRKFPKAEIWVVVRRGTEGILAGCPEIDRILTTARPEEGKRSWRDLGNDLSTLGVIASTKFDYAFELGDNDRGRLLAAASGAEVRCTNSYERPEGEPLSPFWKSRFNRLVSTGHGPVHQVLRDYHAVRETLSLPAQPPPMQFVREAWAEHPLHVSLAGPSPSYAVVHGATRWTSKSWPQDRWREVISSLLERFPRIIISCGPNPREIAEAEELRAQNPERILSTAGRYSWSQLASLLGSASIFVGVDTAAMHLAAAVQCPTVSLFGHPPAYQFRPWEVLHRVVRSRDFMIETERYQLPGEQLMLEITVDQVLGAINSLLTETSGNQAFSTSRI